MLNFVIGIGPGKAGTTWLYNQLSSSGQINISKIKETNHFFKSEPSLRDYKRFFNSKGPSLCLEISNFYFKSDHALESISRLIPNAKIIIFLRDEVDRLLSCFKFEVKQGYTDDFSQYIEKINVSEFNNDLIVRRVRKYFPDEQIFLLRFDDLQERPQELLDELSNFLMIDPVLFREQSYKNPSTLPRNAVFARFGRLTAKVLRFFGASTLLQKLKNSAKIRNLFYTDVPVQLTDGERNMALEILKSSIRNN